MVKFIRERLSAEAFNAHLFQTRWCGSIHAFQKDLDLQITQDINKENSSAKMASWMLVWSFVRRNYLLAIFPIVALYFPIKYNFSRNSMFLFVYTLTAGNWLLEGLPFEILCLAPIAIGLHDKVYYLGTIGQPRNDGVLAEDVTDSKELLCLAGAVLCTAIIKTNLHKRVSLYFIYLSDTRPQKVLAAVVTLTALTNIIMAPILTIILLHPFCSAILEYINDCRKIRMSQEGAGRKDKFLNDFEFQKFSTAVRLAVPFTVNITSIIVFHKNDERHHLLDMPQFLPPMIMLITAQLFLLWIILIIRFVGYHKLWNWSSGVDNMYAYYLLKTERKNRPRMNLTEITVILCIAFLIFLSFAKALNIRVHFLDDCYTTKGDKFTCEMNLERSTLILACILLMMPEKSPNLSILRNYSSNLPRGKWKPLLNWKEVSVNLPWDVILYICTTDIFISEFQRSKLVETIGENIVSNVAIDLEMALMLLPAKVMIFNNLITSKLVGIMFLNDIELVAIKLQMNPLLFIIIVEVTSKYHFIFPFTSLNNMLAYSAGGITKADMITSGFLVWIMCYLTFVINFILLVPYYELHIYSYSQLESLHE